jgi:hypothetical protein
VNLGLVPLLIAALMLITVDSDVDTVEVVFSGQHQIDDHRGALIVGDAQVTIPASAEVPGPIYVIGGGLTVAGTVTTNVIQLAGTVTIESGGIVGDELRLVGGRQSVASGSEIGQRTNFEINPTRGNPSVRLASTGIVTLMLAWIGARLTRSRRHLLDHVTEAVTRHYVVSFTVGTLLSLTALAVFVFMAFTLILIPIALIGIAAGLATLAYGIISLGYLIGTRLPIQRSGWATPSGVVATVVALRLLSLVPLVGALGVLGIVLTAVGAIAITYYGVAPFQPAALPE